MHAEATMTELEERIVSQRIAFAQIRQWGYKWSQIGVTCTIINVHVHMDFIQRELPQFVDETMTIATTIRKCISNKKSTSKNWYASIERTMLNTSI